MLEIPRNQLVCRPDQLRDRGGDWPIGRVSRKAKQGLQEKRGVGVSQKATLFLILKMAGLLLRLNLNWGNRGVAEIQAHRLFKNK
jgi:hypothetical protein